MYIVLFPELNVRIGIDLGDNAVVECACQTRVIDGKGISKKLQLDILGYTTSIATKMTALVARSNYNWPTGI